jgi:hypothetical protein
VSLPSSLVRGLCEEEGLVRSGPAPGRRCLEKLSGKKYELMGRKDDGQTQNQMYS